MKKEDTEGFQVNTVANPENGFTLDGALLGRNKHDMALLEKIKQEKVDIGWLIDGSTKGLDFSDSEKNWFNDKPFPAEDTHSWIVLKVNEGGFFRRLWRQIRGRYRIVTPKTPSPGSKITY
jgi:hypothetical protein